MRRADVNRNKRSRAKFAHDPIVSRIAHEMPVFKFVPMHWLSEYWEIDVRKWVRAQGLEKTPVDTAGYKMALGLVEYTCHDSFDLFFGLFCHNSRSHESLTRVREALSQIERQLAAKEAYLAAKVEMSNSQRRA